MFFSPSVLVEVADFQITYSTSGNQTKKGVPRLVFRKNRTKIWVGGSRMPPKDRPKCGFNNELCPPPTEKPSGLFQMYFSTSCTLFKRRSLFASKKNIKYD